MNVATIGVLALQGDFREHLAVVERLGHDGRELRLPEDLAGIDALILPGGESTTIGKLATRFEVIEPLRHLINSGLPTYGTCAGLIFLAAQIADADQPLLGVLDVVVQRNAFGRQNESFESDIEVSGLESSFHAVFIRAPWVTKVGGNVDVLASVDDHPVMVQQNNIIGTSFHPELTGDDRIHQMLIDMIDQ